jgi:hypothetical protein
MRQMPGESLLPQTAIRARRRTHRALSFTIRLYSLYLGKDSRNHGSHFLSRMGAYGKLVGSVWESQCRRNWPKRRRGSADDRRRLSKPSVTVRVP